MNTHNGPVNRDKPGSIDSDDFNSLGENALIQVSQLSGDIYPTNYDFGLAVAINQYVFGRTAMGLKAGSPYKNEEDGPGKWILPLLDTETGEEFLIRTDKIVCNVGLGEETYGFPDPDATTRDIIDRNATAPLASKQILTYQEVLRATGEEAFLFPRELFSGKTVIVLGGGHSGFTVLENITGLFSGDNYSVAALNGPKGIKFVGSRYASRPEFLEKEYERYAQISTMFPATPDDDTSLVVPLKDYRAFGMREHPDGQIEVLCAKKDGSDPRSIKGDIVITTVGFRSTVRQTFSKLSPSEFSLQRADSGQPEAENTASVLCDERSWQQYLLTLSKTPGCKFICSSGLSVEIDKMEGKQDIFSVKTTTPGEDPRIEELSGDDMAKRLLTELDPQRIEFISWDGTVESLPPLICTETGIALGRFAFADGIILGGPAARLPLTEKDMERHLLYGAPRNKVAVSTTWRETAQLARLCCNDLKTREGTLELKEPSDQTISAPETNASLLLRPSLHILLQFAALRAIRENPTPAALRKSDLNIQLLYDGEGKYFANTSREPSEEERSYMEKIVSDSLLQDLLAEHLPQEVNFPMCSTRLRASLRSVRL